MMSKEERFLLMRAADNNKPMMLMVAIIANIAFKMHNAQAQGWTEFQDGEQINTKP